LTLLNLKFQITTKIETAKAIDVTTATEDGQEKKTAISKNRRGTEAIEKEAPRGSEDVKTETIATSMTTGTTEVIATTATEIAGIRREITERRTETSSIIERGPGRDPMEEKTENKRDDL